MSKTKLVVIAVLGAFAVFAWLSLPPPPRPAGHEHGAGGAPAEGVVVAIDRAQKLLTINHGPLYSLGMPPMTMEFRADDAAVLGTLSVGDKVRFQPQALDGAFVATRIERATP